MAGACSKEALITEKAVKPVDINMCMSGTHIGISAKIGAAQYADRCVKQALASNKQQAHLFDEHKQAFDIILDLSRNSMIGHGSPV